MTMRPTGTVRKIDELGRVVIPKEIRHIYNIEAGTPMEFFVSNDGSINLQKYQVCCTECGEYSTRLLGKAKICKKCAEKLADY